MSPERGDDDLRRSSARLGDRFNRSDGANDRDESATENTRSDDGAEPEWVPTTIYLPEETRRDFRRFLKRLTLDHREIEDAQKRELHAALVRVGMNHPEEVAETVDHD